MVVLVVMVAMLMMRSEWLMDGLAMGTVPAGVAGAAVVPHAAPGAGVEPPHAPHGVGPTPGHVGGGGHRTAFNCDAHLLSHLISTLIGEFEIARKLFRCWKNLHATGQIHWNAVHVDDTHCLDVALVDAPEKI